MSDKYFFLNPDCFFVTGAVNAAIYQLSTGDVYSMDRPAREVVELTEQGVSITAQPERIHAVQSRDEIIAFLQSLEHIQLGKFSDDLLPPSKIEIPRVSYQLHKIWLELTQVCNLRCVHCYADASPQSSNNNLRVKQWQQVIREAADLGAKWLQFIGGEPLLYGKRKIHALISTARQANIDFIEIFTNGILLDDTYIDFLADHHVHIAMSIYSSEPAIHDAVTRCSGSFQKMRANAEKLQRRDVSWRFGLILMKQNYQGEAKTLDWIRNAFGDIAVHTDIIRCTPGGRQLQLACLTPDLWKRKLRTGPQFLKVPLDVFARNRMGHNCLNGEICVQSDGAVYPCIMDREHVLGSVTETCLEAVISAENTQSMWRLGKDQIPICRDCEYRYACCDCRPLAMATSHAMEQSQGGLLSKDPCCLYDPYIGLWGNANAFIDEVCE